MRASVILAVVLLAACSGNPVVMVEPDAGSPQDAGAAQGDAGQPDAGPFDAGLSAPDAGADVDAGQPRDGGRDPLVVARPYADVVPISYVPGTPTPLVVLLHGYTATAATQDAYLRLSDLAKDRGFLLALPDGTVDPEGQHFWNATDACCAFSGGPDDVAYLTAVIADMQAKYTVDPKRIFLIGHSNGAFMSHRMACDRSGLIAGIVALAGDVWEDASRCQPTQDVNILQVHGTLDGIIRYGGGVALVGQPPYPSAEATVETWAFKNGCSGTALERIGGDLDLVVELPFDDTQRYGWPGCPQGGAVELWKIVGGSHVPGFKRDFVEDAYTWLMAHPKP